MLSGVIQIKLKTQSYDHLCQHVTIWVSKCILQKVLINCW